MNRYSKILHHIGSGSTVNEEKNPRIKKRTFEEYEQDLKRTEVDVLREKTDGLQKNIEFLQDYIIKQHDEVHDLKDIIVNQSLSQKNNITEGLLNEPPETKNSDPLTPLDQKFVTFDQLNDHYQLFINRIQQQMSTIGGSGETKFKYLDDVINFIFVGSKSDLPLPVNGSIYLKDNYTYFFTTTVDLGGSRLVSGQNTTILGSSSENCVIKSSGISTEIPLISSSYSTPIRNICIESPWAIELNSSNPSYDLNWYDVRFRNCLRVGIVSGYDRFNIFEGFFDNSQDIVFDGETSSVEFNNCNFNSNSDLVLDQTKEIIKFSSTFSCAVNIVFDKCTFLIPSDFIGIAIQDGATFSNNGIYNPESFILTRNNFITAGSGSALGVSTHTDPEGLTSFYDKNRGIDNTFVIGQYYMNDNEEETTFLEQNTYTKISGITSSYLATNVKFVPSINRLTCNSGIERQYLSQVSLTIIATNNTTCSVAIFDSTNNSILLPSSVKVETPASTPVNIYLNDVHRHRPGDYLEIYIANNENTSPVIVSSLNVLVTQL